MAESTLTVDKNTGGASTSEYGGGRKSRICLQPVDGEPLATSEPGLPTAGLILSLAITPEKGPLEERIGVSLRDAGSYACFKSIAMNKEEPLWRVMFKDSAV